MTTLATDHQIPQTAERIAWARRGDYREEDAELIIGNREGLIALREAIDAALDKGEAFVEASEVEFSHIKVSEQPRPDSEETTSNGLLPILACLLLFGGVAVIFVIGCVQVLRFIF
jgi:hypothetical protein